jgi:hypothetical protein
MWRELTTARGGFPDDLWSCRLSCPALGFDAVKLRAEPYLNGYKAALRSPMTQADIDERSSHYGRSLPLSQWRPCGLQRPA